MIFKYSIENLPIYRLEINRKYRTVGGNHNIYKQILQSAEYKYK